MAELILNPFLAAAVTEIAKPGVGAVAEEGAQVARDHAAVASGEMRDSIHTEETEDGFQIVIGTDHWIFPEFGTIWQAPQPAMRLVIDELGLQR